MKNLLGRPTIRSFARITREAAASARKLREEAEAEHKKEYERQKQEIVD